MNSRFRYFNPNPDEKFVGDCVVRAIAAACNLDWDTAYLHLVVQGWIIHDMPSANDVWGMYLAGRGFKRAIIPNTCPDCYTVADFCRDHDSGIFVVATGTHVVTVIDGYYYDAWDSGSVIPTYYWERRS